MLVFLFFVREFFLNKRMLYCSGIQQLLIFSEIRLAGYLAALNNGYRHRISGLYTITGKTTVLYMSSVTGACALRRGAAELNQPVSEWSCVTVYFLVYRRVELLGRQLESLRNMLLKKDSEICQLKADMPLTPSGKPVDRSVIATILLSLLKCVLIQWRRVRV